MFILLTDHVNETIMSKKSVNINSTFKSLRRNQSNYQQKIFKSFFIGKGLDKLIKL